MMKKSLQILFGLLLILVLAYVAFLDVSTKIKDDLLTKTEVMFSENNVRGVTAKMNGEGLSLSRTLVLTGTAISDVERVRIGILAENIEGVSNIANEIKLYPVVPKVPTVPVVPTVIKTPVVKPLKPIVAKKTPQTDVLKKKIVETLVPSEKMTTKLPTVPTVPIPVRAIEAPKVIEIEKIKLEGVK
jgi:hypothetical protein